MRKISKEEIPALAPFVAKQFLESEELQVMVKGIDPKRAEALAEDIILLGLEYSYKYGEIFVYDDEITGVITGIPNKRRSLIGKIAPLFKMKKAISKLTKEERKQFTKNAATVKQVQSIRWHKKHCKEPSYYLAQFIIAEDKRGQGIAREMLEFLFDRIAEPLITLETHTPKNVPMYEHFGFKVVDTKEAKDGSITEYRMVRG